MNFVDKTLTKSTKLCMSANNADDTCARSVAANPSFVMSVWRKSTKKDYFKRYFYVEKDEM